MKHKLFRVLVALVLVCVLVVNLSPIQVSATGAAPAIQIIKQTVPFFTGGAASGGVALGSAVFGYVAAGLGVVIGGALLSDLVERYQEYSGELDVSIYYYPDGTWSYGVDMGFVERVRTFLWDSGTLVDKFEFNFSTTHSLKLSAIDYVLTANVPFAVVGLWNNSGNSYAKVRYFAYSPTKFSAEINGSAKSSFDYGYYHAIPILTAGSRAYPKADCPIIEIAEQTEAEYERIFGSEIRSEIISTVDGIELGQVAPMENPFSDAYSDWYGNSRPAAKLDSDEEITVLPIPLKPSAAPDVQIESITQPDVWQGSIEEAPAITPPEVIPDTVGLADIWQSIKAIPAALADVITGPIVGGLTKIGDLVKSIPQAIAEAISAIFVPSEDFLTAKWEAIRAEFAFADSITATGEVLVNILDGLDPEPPVIYIDLGATEGSYNIGGEVPFVDLRWYARYKPTMDLIISAFLWLAFVWRLLLKLPGIISGMPGEFVLMNLPVNLPHLGIGSSQRREELESGRNNRRLGDGH